MSPKKKWRHIAMEIEEPGVVVNQLGEHKKQPSIKRILSYYPIRYHLSAFLIAYVLFNASTMILDIQEQSLVYMFSFLDRILSSATEQISTIIGSTSSFGNINYNFYPVIPPILVYIQIPFLAFYPTVAFTARTSLKIRGKILLGGLLTFTLFILILFFTALVSGLLGLGPLGHSELFVTAAGFVTVVGGSLLMELTLFSSITKPSRLKIQPIIKRSYRRNYTYLIALIASAVLAIYMLSEVSVFFKENPVVVFAAIHLLNLRTIAIFGSYVSFIIYKIGGPTSRSTASSNVHYTPTISFLVPAANEERLIARCINSIDEACYKYPIKNEVIVVNDGSADDTERIAYDTLKRLKHCTGRLYTIPNSGKGHALQYGLEKARGEILFRIDADSLLDKEAIAPIIKHFQDPTVGSAGGMILPLEPRSHWQKMVVLFYVLFSNLNKGTQGLADAVLVQSGAYSVFRRDALIRIGGWTQNQFGEDGEITNRIGRYGYKVIFEPNSLVYGDVPASLYGIMSQRARWSIAYYHSRGRHLDLVTDIKEFRRPRSVFFFLNILSHGGAIAHGLMWSAFVAVLLAGTLDVSIFSHMPPLLILPFHVMLIPTVILVLALIMLLYYLRKYMLGISIIKYFPVVWLYSIINAMIVIITAMEVALYWSSKWKKYSDDAYLDLRKEIKKGVDPLHG
jgi:cellulose synthase/poly-beta-1,6-N-acetylglucosamine synthase-like glycosyltransferase